MRISDIPDAVRREATEYVDKISTPDAELREFLINAVRYDLLADRWQSRPLARKACCMTGHEAFRAGTMVRALGRGLFRCAEGTMTKFTAEILTGIRQPDGSPEEVFFTLDELAAEQRRIVEARLRRSSVSGGGAA